MEDCPNISNNFYQSLTPEFTDSFFKSGRPECFPVLQNILNDFADSASAALEPLINAQAQINLASITGTTFTDYHKNLPANTLATIIENPARSAIGLLCFESGAGYTILNAMLGYTCQFTYKQNSEPYTFIEKSLLGEAVLKILTALAEHITFILAPTNNHIYLSKIPDIQQSQGNKSKFILSSFTIEIAGHTGTFTLLLPYNKMMNLNLPSDPSWQNNLKYNLRQSSIETSAKLTCQHIPLREVLNWKIGSKISLDIANDPTIFFGPGNKNLFTAKLGHKGQNLAIRIDKTIA